ncbi:plasmid pRiA4b ORF-3 family protein [Brucella pseudogrignonensis]|uniref:plasmid pRiA4b ORF-3 family protein n=1 Tax=Brucella pseudogrignonensis TaxID=419475 RepID=UPI003ECEAB27
MESAFGEASALRTPSRRISLLSAVQDAGGKSFKYFYDFGDSWEHSIRIERVFPAIGKEGPMLLEATGNFPPEDVGGPWGYQEFCDALADPVQERHAETLECWRAAIMIPPPLTSRRSTKPSMTWL